MSQMYLITDAFSALVVAFSYLGMLRLIKTLNRRFPILLNVALSRPQRISYDLMASAMMRAGLFSSFSESFRNVFVPSSSDIFDRSSAVVMPVSPLVAAKLSFLSE